MDKDQNSPINVKLAFFNETEFSFSVGNYAKHTKEKLYIDERNKIDLGLQFNHNYAWNFEDNIFTVRFIINLKNPKDLDETESTTVKLGCHYMFEIDDLKNVISIPEKKEDLTNADVKFPKGMKALIIGICISTSRGLLYSRLKGTIFERSIIPIIDIKKYLDFSKEEI